MIRINQLKLSIYEPVTLLKEKVSEALSIDPCCISSIRLIRRSLDARKSDLLYNYTLLVETKLGAKKEEMIIKKSRRKDLEKGKDITYTRPSLNENIAGIPKREYFSITSNRPIIAGFGPAGMFAGLILADAGMRPIIYERGSSVDERIRKKERFLKEGILDEESNLQFGEGGAGTFSDGKLNTLVKDDKGRCGFILNKFTALGADPKILTDQKPHVGTDRLVEIIRNIRYEIEALGGEIHFDTKYEYNGEENVILATGHSARDTYYDLKKKGVLLEAKDFAMGFRVKHRQENIDKAMYGPDYEKAREVLGSASYRLSHTSGSKKRGVYSFCMCPGGYIINCSSEKGRLTVNGMSYSKRDGEYANSAVVVSVRREDYGGDKDPLSGIELQREIERRTFETGHGHIPCQSFGEFKRHVLENLKEEGFTAKEIDPENENESLEKMKGGVLGETVNADLSRIFSFSESSPYRNLNDFNECFIEGMESFSRQIPGFSSDDTYIYGTEARTSSPVRIPRDSDFQSNIKGLYPIGEGAGYAGGIMSAAIDGMKAAEKLIEHYNNI